MFTIRTNLEDMDQLAERFGEAIEALVNSVTERRLISPTTLDRPPVEECTQP